MSEDRIPETRETVIVGPFPIFFCNTNTKMALKSHCHLADVSLAYETIGDMGYPSFQATNDHIRHRLRDHTGVENRFKDSTNEDVCRFLWRLFDGWQPAAWEMFNPMEGSYRLAAVRLEVKAAEDAVGHDPGITRYTVERA